MTDDHDERELEISYVDPDTGERVTRPATPVEIELAREAAAELEGIAHLDPDPPLNADGDDQLVAGCRESYDEALQQVRFAVTIARDIARTAPERVDAAIAAVEAASQARRRAHERLVVALNQQAARAEQQVAALRAIVLSQTDDEEASDGR